MIIILFLFLFIANCQYCNETGGLYGCPCVPPIKYVATCDISNNLKEYTVSGSHYQIGYQIGTKLKTSIRKYILSQTTDCVNTYEKLGYISQLSIDGSVYKKNFNKLKHIAKEYYPQYVEELQGIIDATELPENYIWAMNFQDEMFVTNMSKEKLSNKKGPEGCSNILIQDTQGNVIFGHNEDGDPTMDRKMVLLHINLIDDNYNDYYNYTVGYYLGMLPGWSFGFNSYGMIIDFNSIFPLQLGYGLGTAWISRDVFSAKNIDDAITKISPPGTALGISANIGSIDEDIWMNVEGQPNGVKFITNHTANIGKPYYFHHFNNYLTQTNNIWYHETTSTLHREVNLAKFTIPETVEDVGNILSDMTDIYTHVDLDHKTYVFWRRDPNLDYAFTHSTVLANTNIDKSVTYRVYGTGVNPKKCPNTYSKFVVKKLQ